MACDFVEAALELWRELQSAENRIHFVRKLYVVRPCKAIVLETVVQKSTVAVAIGVC